jgi:hypothetical protein
MAIDSSMDVEVVRPVARNRARTSGRPYRVHVRLTSEEWDAITAAAARAGLKPTAFAGAAAVSHHRRAAQIPTTPAAHPWFMAQPVIGVIHLGQSESLLPFRAPRALTRLLPQRLRRRLGQPIRTRRLAGVLRRHPQPGLKLLNPRYRHRQPRPKLNVLRQQLPIRRRLRRGGRLGHAQIQTEHKPDDNHDTPHTTTPSPPAHSQPRSTGTYPVTMKQLLEELGLAELRISSLTPGRIYDPSRHEAPTAETTTR